MQHFPIFLDTAGKTIVVSGAGECAAAKLRLLMKTQSELYVYGENPCKHVLDWSAAGKIHFTQRRLLPADLDAAMLVYAANDDARQDAMVSKMAKAAGVLTNVVDNLSDSDFITPALVDRDPVTIAIGTEGAAPVLARKIKRLLEDELAENLGHLARIAKTFRNRVEILPMGPVRRQFWSEFYAGRGAAAWAAGGERAVLAELETMLKETVQPTRAPIKVHVIDGNLNDLDLLTLRARNQLNNADIVLHQANSVPAYLELARREAIITPFQTLGEVEGLLHTATKDDPRPQSIVVLAFDPQTFSAALCNRMRDGLLPITIGHVPTITHPNEPFTPETAANIPAAPTYSTPTAHNRELV